MIAREDLLPGEEGPWLVQRRNELHALLMRSIDALISIYTVTDNLDLAVQFAEDAIARDPFREPSYQQLIETYARSGQISAAARAYQRCCDALAEIGRKPSPPIQAAYRRAKQSLKDLSGRRGLVPEAARGGTVNA